MPDKLWKKVERLLLKNLELPAIGCQEVKAAVMISCIHLYIWMSNQHMAKIQYP